MDPPGLRLGLKGKANVAGPEIKRLCGLADEMFDGLLSPALTRGKVPA